MVVTSTRTEDALLVLRRPRSSLFIAAHSNTRTNNRPPSIPFNCSRLSASQEFHCLINTGRGLSFEAIRRPAGRHRVAWATCLTGNESETK